MQCEVLFLQVSAAYPNGWLNAQVSVFEMAMMAQTKSTAKLNVIEVWVEMVYLVSAFLFELNSPAFQ
jgi:hypothetical protein